MRSFSRQVSALLLAVSVAFNLFPAGGATAATNGSSCWTAKDEERGFARRINRARNNAGTGRLRLDPELSRAARGHTRAMANQNRLYHTPAKRLRWKVTNWRMLGENVGVGGTVGSLHQAFMDSAPHRANVVMREFRYMGVGVKKSGRRMWVTVIFEARTDPGTRLNMPSC
jgi:uncharacterized protein YkwD